MGFKDITEFLLLECLFKKSMKRAFFFCPKTFCETLKPNFTSYLKLPQQEQFIIPSVLMLGQAFCSRGSEASRVNLSPREDFKNHDTSMLGWVQSQSLQDDLFTTKKELIKIAGQGWEESD